MNEAEPWWNGRPWLFDPFHWPADNMTEVMDKSNAEKKVQRELFVLVVDANDDFDTVLKKFSLWKAIRICVWISRLNHDSLHPSAKIIGALVTEEIQQKEMSWIIGA